ncbi:hypothetical protein [Planktomarina sp.]|uniref:hypothetical protein n=1 Tax=Planktomarina sp. TaxID=2024851 RepID=UPI003260B50E
MSGPPPLGGSWREWAERLNNYIARTRNKLDFKLTGDSASEDGIMLWDASIDHMVVSTDGAFQPIPYGENSYGYFVDFTNQTASGADTATAITYNTSASSHNVSIDGTDASKIVFAKSGIYRLNFSAEITSSSGSTVTFYFWPRINGVNLANSTMVTTLHNNGQKKIISRSGVFDVNANDYLQSMFAVDSTNGSLSTTAATSFCTASPSVTLSVAELYVP